MSNADRASRLTLKRDGEGTCGGDRLLSQSVSLAGDHVQGDGSSSSEEDNQQAMISRTLVDELEGEKQQQL